MLVNLEVMDYLDRKFDTGFSFDLDDLRMMIVEVISGDEIVMPWVNGQDVKRFDVSDISEDYRIMSFEDGCYVVDKNNFEAWTNRKDTYEFMR